MKKILFLLTALIIGGVSAWAEQTEVTSLITTTDVTHPVATYRMWLKDNNNNTCIITKNLEQKGYGTTEEEARFCFVTTGTANEYYIYETVNGKYVKATSSENATKSGTGLVESTDDACKWKIVSSTTSKRWLISPKGRNTYMNFFQGLSANQNAQTIGFWTDGNSDQGSRWAFDLVEHNQPYAINFENEQHKHQGNVNSRRVSQLKLGDQTIDVEPTGNYYQDYYDTKTFTITKGTNVKPQIIWDGAWMAAYVYVDTNSDDSQFTVEELVSNTNGEGTHNFTTDLPEFSITTAGTYHMRYKVDWNSTDPGGSATIKNDGGYIFDVKLVVEDPEAIITYDYYLGEEQVATEDLPGVLGEAFPNPSKAFAFYTLSNKPTGNVQETGTHRIDLTWNGPFVADGTTTYALGVRLNDEGVVDYYVKSDGTNAPTHTSQEVKKTADYLWMFERVEGTADQFYLKNSKYGYITTNTNSASTMNASNKTAMKLGEYTGDKHREGKMDFFLIDAQNNSQVFGDHKTVSGKQVLGYWDNGRTNNEGSAFQVVEVSVPDIEITVSEHRYATFYDEVDRQIPQGLNAYYCTRNENNLQAEQLTDNIPAHVGVVLELKSDTEPGTFIFTKSTEEITPTEDLMASCLTGTTVDKNATGDEYVLSIVSGNVGFYRYASTATLKAHRAFYVDNGFVQGFVLNFGGEQTTGIKFNENGRECGNQSFDLQGRRVNADVKGISIQNNKKVIR